MPGIHQPLEHSEPVLQELPADLEPVGERGQLLYEPELDEPELDDPAPELEPVQVPSVVQLVQVLLPALVYSVVQLEQEVAVPPLEYVPSEQATQLDPLT